MKKRGRKAWHEGMSASDLAIIHDPSRATNNGYIIRNDGGKKMFLHVWIWEQLVGPIPSGFEIDHENGVRHDCRLINLRCIPKKINLRNAGKAKNNTSGKTGCSRVTIKGNHYWVVTWSDPVTSKKRSKYFSVLSLGDDKAKQDCYAFRDVLEKDFIANHGYTTRHGY